MLMVAHGTLKYVCSSVGGVADMIKTRILLPTHGGKPRDLPEPWQPI